MERDDDRRLNRGIEEWPKTKLAHAVHERFAIACVAREPRRLASFGIILIERGIQRDDDVRRRRETPLRRLFHIRPLVVKIEGERCRASGALFERRSPHQNEPHPRRPFDTFAGCANQRIERRHSGVDRQRAERAHRIDDETLAVTRYRCRNLRQWVQDARRCLTVDQADVRDRCIARQQSVDVFRRCWRVLRRFEYRELAAHHLGQLRKSLAVRAVDQRKDVTVARHERIDRGLDGERSAALHRNADVRAVQVNHAEQLVAHFAGDGVEIRIPRAPVAEHRGFRLQRRCQRTWRQENGIARKVGHDCRPLKCRRINRRRKACATLAFA